MKSTDRHGLPITNANNAVVEGYDAYVTEFLSYGSQLRELFSVADSAPDCALVNAHAAALHLAFEGAEGWESAQPYLRRMEDAGSYLTEREQLFCSAVAQWARRDFYAARLTLDELTVRWPADLCAMKWGQYHAFNLGDQDGLLRFGQRTAIAHEGTAYAHGMVAFGLEQNHQLEEAEDEGYRAVEIAIDDAWAHHAVAHVMETQGRAQEGANWLDHCAHTWERKGVFIRDHNWWHAALFRLSLGQLDDALSLFDRRLWGEWPEFPQEQIGAVSILWRLEMRGADVGERWAPVVEQARARTGEHYFPFHDMHYLFALSRAGAPGEGKAFLESVHRHAETLEGRCGEIWRSAGVPCANAVFALASEDYAGAVSAFEMLGDKLQLIGGSHAQRHLFVEAKNWAQEMAVQGVSPTRRENFL